MKPMLASPAGAESSVAQELEAKETKPAAPLNVWQQAIDAELVSTHLGVAHNDATLEDAQKALHELICWHIAVATDPATNGGQRLTDAKPIVLPELLEACKSLLTLTQLMANEAYNDGSIVEFEIFSEKTKSTRCLVLVFELAKARAAIAKATGAGLATLTT